MILKSKWLNILITLVLFLSISGCDNLNSNSTNNDNQDEIKEVEEDENTETEKTLNDYYNNFIGAYKCGDRNLELKPNSIVLDSVSYSIDAKMYYDYPEDSILKSGLEYSEFYSGKKPTDWFVAGSSTIYSGDTFYEGLTKLAQDCTDTSKNYMIGFTEYYIPSLYSSKGVDLGFYSIILKLTDNTYVSLDYEENTVTLIEVSIKKYQCYKKSETWQWTSYYYDPNQTTDHRVEKGYIPEGWHISDGYTQMPIKKTLEISDEKDGVVFTKSNFDKTNNTTNSTLLSGKYKITGNSEGSLEFLDGELKFYYNDILKNTYNISLSSNIMALSYSASGYTFEAEFEITKVDDTIIITKKDDVGLSLIAQWTHNYSTEEMILYK